MTDGDEEMKQSIIDSFLEEFPQLLSELEICIANKNIEEIGKICHKMKSPIALFGMSKLLEDVIYLEKYSKNIDKELVKGFSDYEDSKNRMKLLFLNLKSFTE